MYARAARGALLAAVLAAPQLHAASAAQKDVLPGIDPAVAREARSSAAMDQMIRADVNKDGMVTHDEVERLDSRLGRRFKAADTDRNGRLTLPEFEKLRELNQGATAGASTGGRTSGPPAPDARR